MKKTVLAIMCITALMLTACGGGNTKKKAADGNADTKAETKTEAAKGGGSVKLADVSESNWQSVVKSNFGVDIAVPSGWSFQKVQSPNGVNNLILNLTIGGDTTGEAMGKKLFEATKAISKHGNYKNKVNWDAETVAAGDVINDISEVDSMSDSDVIASWNFSFNGRMVMVNYSAIGKNVKYTFTLN